MPKHVHDQLKYVTGAVYFKGIVEDLDTAQDMAAVRVPALGGGYVWVPIRYHCTHEAEEGSAGALVGASGAFGVGDEVIVRYFRWHGTWQSQHVVGFADGSLRPCSGPCFIVGEIEAVIGAADSRELTLEIRDLNNEIHPILTRPSDWIGWEVGDRVLAINWDNCDCAEICLSNSDRWSQTNTLMDLTNTFREGEGLPPLTLNRKLQRAAQWMAEDQSANCLLGHVGSDGSDLSVRLTRFGYTGWTYGGENASLSLDIESAFVGWLNSPGHYANLVHPEFREMGFGVFELGACDTIYDTYHDVEYTKGIDYANGYRYFYHVFGTKTPEPWVVTPIAVLETDLP